ncbi:MAG: hypothetical protein LBM99_03890 [Bacillales bacterium]|jgi:predicted DNA-binding protein YlxM (UPF0122 family)|nr:hypothetical protein [Bacillales bacterium]
MINIEIINKYADYYHNFLNENQQKIYEYYFIENYSLQEIASINKTSRNAVFLIVKRIEKIFLECEKKLKLLGKMEHIQKIVDADTYKKILDIMEGEDYGI